jgi:hypothetical protein
MNINEFYPTPAKVIEKMLAGIDLENINSILEPNAGRGDIVDVLIATYEKQKYSLRYHSNRTLDIDTVEIDPNLRHILKGNGYRVIHDDFLTLRTHKSYDLIIMNPPFSDGDKHLLKALDMQQYGGKVVCLLNAETLRNPFTVTRKDLIRRLDEYEAEIEYVSGAFASAEVPTDVEVALVKVEIPHQQGDSIILSGLRQQEEYVQDHPEIGSVAHRDFFERIISQYNYEIRAGLTLIDEYKAMTPLIMDSLSSEYKKPVLKLEIDGHSSNMANTYVQQIRLKYWQALFVSPEFSQAMTTKIQQEFRDKLNELKDYDFSFFNIWQIREDISRNLIKSVEDSIIEMFDEFSHKHSWIDETSKNIHYYNGWKTNQCWIVNKKVILPWMNAWNWCGKLDYSYDIARKLRDIEKAFDYLNGSAMDHSCLDAILRRAEECGQTKKIHLKYFTVTFYKKHTCHIEFSDLELLKKFNLFGSQRKGWLPPSYGKAHYDDMAQEEKDVIDSFEGKEEYEKVLKNSDYYLTQPTGLLMLEAG